MLIADWTSWECGQCDFQAPKGVSQDKAYDVVQAHIRGHYPQRSGDAGTSTEARRANSWKIEVFQEDDGRWAAEFDRPGLKDAGMGEYSSTALGALAEVISTLIKVEEDRAKEAARDARLAERERCAKLAENAIDAPATSFLGHVAHGIAAVIRQEPV